jgi:hypothetical protein
MTFPDDPNLRLSPPPHLQRRDQRIQKWKRRALHTTVWFGGLALTTAIIYEASLLYYRFEDQHQQEADRSSVPMAVARIAVLERPTAPSNTIWVPGTWERQAQRFITAQLSQTVSSAIPPHRRRLGR